MWGSRMTEENSCVKTGALTAFRLAGPDLTRGGRHRKIMWNENLARLTGAAGYVTSVLFYEKGCQRRWKFLPYPKVDVPLFQIGIEFAMHKSTIR